MVSHLLYPRDAVSLGHQGISELPVRNLRKSTVCLFPFHVDEVKLLHPDICIDVKQLVELADLCKKTRVVGTKILLMGTQRCLCGGRGGKQSACRKARYGQDRTLKNRTVSMFLLLNSHHWTMAGVSLLRNDGGTYRVRGLYCG